MRQCINATDIPKEIREKLPVISEETSEERFCTSCPYYAGAYGKTKHCMVCKCAWDDDREIFHPALKELLEKVTLEFNSVEAVYLEKKKKRELLESMFSKELKEEKEQKKKCYGCPYGKNRVCLGVCYADLKRKEKKEE